MNSMKRVLLAATLAAVPGLARAQATPACAATSEELTLQQMIEDCDSWRSLDLPPGSSAAGKFGERLDAIEARLKEPHVTPSELDELRSDLHDWKISVAKDLYRPTTKGRLGAGFCAYVKDETQRAAMVGSISSALSHQAEKSTQERFDDFFAAPAPFDGGLRAASAAEAGDSSAVIAPAADPGDPARYKKVRQILISEGARPRIVDDAIREALRQHKDPLLVLSVINAESGFHAHAHSAVGARGLMQLMPATGRNLGVRSANMLYDAKTNLRAGIAYLGSLWNKFANLSMSSLQTVDPFSRLDLKEVIAAYNAGPGAVDKYGGVPPYRETQKYVRRVLAYYARLKNYLA